MGKLVVGRKTMRRGEAHLHAATDMFSNTPTVTSLLHEHVGGRHHPQSRFRWDRTPREQGSCDLTRATAKPAVLRLRRLSYHGSSLQYHLTKEQRFQWSGLTRSEDVIGPFSGLHTTGLSHRPLRQGPEHLAEGPRPIRSGLSIGPIYWAQCNQLARNRKMPGGAGSGP